MHLKTVKLTTVDIYIDDKGLRNKFEKDLRNFAYHDEKKTTKHYICLSIYDMKTWS
jgi:hypothetical protein